MTSLVESGIFAAAMLILGVVVSIIMTMPVIGTVLKYLNPACWLALARGNPSKCSDYMLLASVVITYAVLGAGIMFFPAIIRWIPWTLLIMSAIATVIIAILVDKFGDSMSMRVQTVLVHVLGSLTIPLGIFAMQKFGNTSSRQYGPGLGGRLGGLGGRLGGLGGRLGKRFRNVRKNSIIPTGK